jgi:hypothetical protein
MTNPWKLSKQIIIAFKNAYSISNNVFLQQIFVHASYCLYIHVPLYVPIKSMQVLTLFRPIASDKTPQKIPPNKNPTNTTDVIVASSDLVNPHSHCTAGDSTDNNNNLDTYVPN